MDIKTIIGIDAASLPENIGLAMATFDGGEWNLIEYCTGKRENRWPTTTSALFSASNPVDILKDWIETRKNEGAVLLAIDAPLGWPDEMRIKLPIHTAGNQLSSLPSDNVFMRETDRFINKILRKKPLSIGADKIARASHITLQNLNNLRTATGLPIPLNWTPSNTTNDPVSAIEAYPTATLYAYKIKTSSKKANQDDYIKRINEELFPSLTRLSFPTTFTCPKVDHITDAIICVCAGIDFISGHVHVPTSPTAYSEGWIWVRKN